MNTIFIGKNLVSAKCVSSTNTYAMELLSNSKPLPEGTVIMAEEQSNGRGQQGSYWESEPGKNLIISLVLYPTFLSADKQFYLSKVISVAITDLIEDIIGERVNIKWPNDIYYERLKLGGILIENILMGSSIKASVIGIGLNINQELFYSNARNPVSLKNITQQEDFDINSLLEKLCRFIEIRYLQLRAGKSEVIDEEYLSRLLQYEQYCIYKTSKGRDYGTITGVSAEGKLQVLFNQSVEEFANKEIEFLI
jgi:BirA family transcriptional regulator, biotin operon repressor / biotin---[acetyl-CoA-carboxylase] ligase